MCFVGDIKVFKGLEDICYEWGFVLILVCGFVKIGCMGVSFQCQLVFGCVEVYFDSFW